MSEKVSTIRRFGWRTLRWLCSLGLVDVLVILAFLFPQWEGGIALPDLSLLGVASTAALPFIAIATAVALPDGIKDSLIFWRGSHAFPSHMAFTQIARADERIDMDSLRANLGPLPTEPMDQAVLWNAMYHKADHMISVVEARRTYALFRDLTAMSALMIIPAPAALYGNGAAGIALWLTAGFFSLQYVTLALVGRRSGSRLLSSVLVIESSGLRW